MNIKTQLTTKFSIIVASLLIVFSLAIYYFSAGFRRDDFYARLKDRALTTARLLISVKEVDRNLMRIIDENTNSTLYLERVLVYDENNHLIYNSDEKEPASIPRDILKKIQQSGHLSYEDGNRDAYGLIFTEKGQFVVIASAYDLYGFRKLVFLRNLLILGLLIGIGVIVLAGRLFAGQVLQPIIRMNNEILRITERNLNMRIDEGSGKDEIARLARNFNRMLERLESAFSIQRNFVSNASHELRTPLAAMQGQLQVALSKKRTPEAYEAVLLSVQEDVKTLSDLTNGLLELANSSSALLQFNFKSLRVDEVLFQAQQDLQQRRPNYKFEFVFLRIPEDEMLLTAEGNETYLRTVFMNLMDNACKFSPDHKVRISFDVNDHEVRLSFSDNGIGIPESDLPHIFEPLYRASNAKDKKGYGIGLSLCKKLIELHHGRVEVQSVHGRGSTFSIVLPLGTKK